VVDPKGRIAEHIRGIVQMQLDNPPGNVPPFQKMEDAVDVLLTTILTDYAAEVADLVVGRLVRNGSDTEMAKDIGGLIEGHAKRFNVA